MTTVRVYINGRGIDAPAEGTALDAVRAWDAAVAGQVESGERALTDSRGLPVGADTSVFHGAIFRVVSGRARTSEPA